MHQRSTPHTLARTHAAPTALLAGFALASSPAAADPPPPPAPAAAPAPSQGDAPPPALAPPAPSGDDVLNLRDGGMLRGRITERRADGTVVIVLLTGEARTVDGALISSIGATTTPPPPAVEPPRPPPAPAPRPRPVVDLGPDLSLRDSPARAPIVVESTGAPMAIGQSMGQTVTTGFFGMPTVNAVGNVLCSTPCTLYARPRVVALWSGGEGLRSDSVTVTVPDSGVRIRLRAASSAGYAAGYGLTVVGAIGLVGGAGLLVFGLSGGAGGSRGPVVLGGGIAFGVGALFLGLGIPLLALNQTGLVSRTPLDPDDAPRSARNPRATVRLAASMGPLPEGGALGALGGVF